LKYIFEKKSSYKKQHLASAYLPSAKKGGLLPVAPSGRKGQGALPPFPYQAVARLL